MDGVADLTVCEMSRGKRSLEKTGMPAKNYSALVFIIKGWFNTHISYMGTTNIIKKVITINISPVSIVMTNKGDTYVMSQGDTKSNVTPKKEPHVVRIFNVGLAIVRYSTWTMIINTTGMVNK